MNWKTDLKLADLEATTAIEVVCKRCNLTRYETPAELMVRNDFKNAYLDEVDTACIVKTRSKFLHMVLCCRSGISALWTRTGG